MYSLSQLFQVIRAPFSYVNTILSQGKAITRKVAPVRMSTAARFAVAFFICFAIFITIIWIVGSRSPDSYLLNSMTEYMFGARNSWIDFPLYYLISLLISVGVYWGIRVATLERPSLYPEIDQCWEPIQQWREKQNLDWHEFRRYLVLGSDLETAKAMHAEMKDRKIGPLPTGVNDWMHWFGTEDSLYVHLKNIASVSERNTRLGAGSKRGAAAFDAGSTLQASVGVPDWGGSVGMDDMTAEVDGSFGMSADGFGDSLDGAMSLDPYADAPVEMPDDLNVASGKAEPTDEDDATLGEEGDRPIDRVRYLSQLIRTKTEGQMPLHGVLVVIPFDKFMSGENYKSITAAIKSDLLEIRRQTEISFPVSLVFCSMEKDQGFPKLQNLLGAQRAETGRFGAGCRVNDIPVLDKTNIELQTQRACTSIEDWVINRWGKSSQLSRAAQNKELFKLTVRIRQKFRPHLEFLMKNALLWLPSEMPDNEAVDLSLCGCYFVSTGQHASERGFLNGLFAKCEEFSETASWSPEAVEKNRFLTFAAGSVTLLSIAMIIGLCLFFWFR